MRVLGKHTIANLENCKCDDIDNIEYIEEIMTNSAKECSLHVVDKVFHKFEPIGISGVLVLSESHIAIHTWPEYGFVAIDAFTCGQKMRPQTVCESIAKKLKCDITSLKNIYREMKGEENIERLYN